MTWAVRTEGLGKTYRIRVPGADGALRWVERDALRSVDMEVAPGEVLGVIGRNGAGKSTLLKILSRITTPTRGRALVRGRVASLLEVGTGMHPEMTGRENVSLNGAILGMTAAEIRSRFDEIVAFSGVGDYLDTPLKHYSSGMRLRLAFSVAAFLSAEVLIVDEVLAVGDAEFQKRCVGAMRSGMAGGRTALFVSHNMLAVRSVCSRCVWLKDGGIHRDGPAEDVTAAYLEEFTAVRLERTFDPPAADADAAFLGARVIPPGGGSVGVETGCSVEVTFRSPRPGARLHVTVHVLAEDGVCVLSSASLPVDGEGAPPLAVGDHEARVELPAWLLNAGSYTVTLFLVEDGTRVLRHEEHALAFAVRDSVTDRAAWYGRWPGVVRPRLRWDVRPLDARRAGGPPR